MGAGNLNCQVTVQAKTKAADSTGQMIETWADSFSVWAEIITTGGGDFYAAQKMHAQATAVMRIRYTHRVTSRNRIRSGNRVYEILGPPNDENGAHQYLLLSCKEVV